MGSAHDHLSRLRRVGSATSVWRSYTPPITKGGSARYWTLLAEYRRFESCLPLPDYLMESRERHGNEGLFSILDVQVHE